jgi:hypothetical protein
VMLDGLLEELLFHAGVLLIELGVLMRERVSGFQSDRAFLQQDLFMMNFLIFLIFAFLTLGDHCAFILLLDDPCDDIVLGF